MSNPGGSDSREYVLTAGQIHHDILTGHGITVDQALQLGPLLELISVDGAWRSPTHLHEYMVALLKDLKSRPVQTRRNIDPRIILEVADRVWGVSHYPESRRNVARVMGLSEASVRNYLEDVAGECDPTSLVKIGASSVVLPSIPFRVWSGKPADWCTTNLIETAGAVLAEQGVEIDFNFTRRLLQRAVLTWLDAYLQPHTSHPNVWGYYYHHLRLVWEEDDPFWPGGGSGPRESSAPGGQSKYHRAVAAATQVGCEVVARNAQILLRSHGDRFAVRHFLDGVVLAAAQNPQRSLVVSSGLQGRMLGAALAGVRREATSLERAGGVDLLASLEADQSGTPVVGIVTHAVAIRSAGTAVEKQDLIRLYEKKRRSVDLSRAGKDDENAIAWADQSVGWDATTSVSHFSNALTRARIDNPLSVGHPGFETLLLRDQSIRANKRGDSWRALVLAANGIERLKKVNEIGSIDDVEAFETLQQHALSLAGLFTRLGEGALTRNPLRSGSGLSNNIRWSYHLSAIACDQVAQLSSEHGLPESKSGTNRISTSRWQIQPRIIHLRSLLVAITGLVAGIVPARNLTANYGDRNFVAGPPLPYDPRGLAEQLLAEIERSYRGLVCRSEIINSDRPAIAQIALWYMFLMRCNLPTPPANEIAPRLRVDGYLVADPDDDIARICGYSSVQPHLPTQVLVEFGFNALILGRIATKSRVAQTLEDRSGKQFYFWRAQDALLVDQHFGHPRIPR